MQENICLLNVSNKMQTQVYQKKCVDKNQLITPTNKHRFYTYKKIYFTKRVNSVSITHF